MSNDYYKTLPKKRMGAEALIFNNKNELLTLKPSYKDYWSIPGGVIEENESPKAGCVREVKEEIGLDVSLQFLCVDWTSSKEGKGDSLQFIFYGGVLPPEQENAIKLETEEISDYKFLAVDQALLLLSEKLKRRVPKCLEALKKNTALYLEDEN